MYTSFLSILYYPTLFLGALCLVLAGNYFYLSLRFKSDLHKFQNARSGKRSSAPHIPSLLPWIGVAPSFLTTKPLAFWKRLFEWYPRDAGACTLTMGGQTAYVIFNTPATQYILKDRKLGRDHFNELVVKNGLGLSPEECDRYYTDQIPLNPGELSSTAQQERINLEYLLRAENVNELTAKFLSTISKQNAGEFQDGPGEIDLYEWLRKTVFVASTTALWGDRVLKAIPDFEELFFIFDRDILSLFYGLPKFMVSKPIANRDLIVDKLVRYYETVDNETDGKIADPVTVAWEPIYGSRFSRARQLFSRNRGLTVRSVAGLELGSLFGLASNAIPAIGWMFFHILDSKRGTENPSLYDHIMAEIQASKKNGSIDIALLAVQPILQSTLHEVLRMYVDMLVTRQIDQEMTLPLTPEKSERPRSLLLKANSLLMMPTYPAHTDPVTWESSEYPHHPPVNVFYPYRFLTSIPSDGDKPIFTTAHTVGKFFPFGGGKTMCPGRVFAKQEITGSVAICLDTFDFKVLSYLDEQKRSSQKFPGLRDSLPGSTMMVPGGDMRVRVKRRGQSTARS